MYLASSNKMYLVSDTFSCHTLHCTGTPAGHSMDTVLILLTLPNQIHKEMLMKLLNYAIYAPSESVKILFLKSSFCYVVYASQYYFLMYSYLPAAFVLCSRLLDCQNQSQQSRDPCWRSDLLKWHRVY